ncbi:hypothetical protein DUI87_27279 [Hirundo rustica rustica]|uniref:Uncharacterized protein n=1 Tax=Hirundo rustica rustica TaxID=333673 RepID=A0A3M0J555_HIRRU|nr:hypothetical protein DUI87_27279 [Hirundo rustica rustica]
METRIALGFWKLTNWPEGVAEKLRDAQQSPVSAPQEKEKETKQDKAFASLGVPQEIKTDKGPTYIGKVLDKFLKRWGVHHTFGIPHSPTGQAIIERTHQTLKTLLDRQKRGEAVATPYMRLNKALNPETGQIEGPFKLITWGKGYACVSTAVGPKWLAARNVKPYRVHTQAEADPKTGEREVATQT